MIGVAFQVVVDRCFHIKLPARAYPEQAFLTLLPRPRGTLFGHFPFSPPARQPGFLLSAIYTLNGRQEWNCWLSSPAVNFTASGRVGVTVAQRCEASGNGAPESNGGGTCPAEIGTPPLGGTRSRAGGGVNPPVQVHGAGRSPQRPLQVL